MASKIPLNTVCERKITTLSPQYHGPIEYVDISSVDNIEKRIVSSQIFDAKDAPSRAKQLIKRGDILVSTVRPNLNAVAIVDRESEHLFVASTGYCVLRCNSKTDNHYVFHFCQSPYFIDDMVSQATGASYPAVSSTIVKNSLIPLPSLGEQKHIAAVLDKVSDLIALRKQQLAKLDELVKARFVEMFGDPKTNPNDYPVVQLSEYIQFLTSGSRGWAQYCTNDGSEWFITIKNVKDCRISIDNMQPVNAPDNAEARRTKVQEGDLLISITADLGRTGVVTKEIAEHGAYINQHLTCIRLNKEILNPLYVAFFMESPAGKEQFESKNQSAVKAGLNFNSINSLRLIVPPMNEQNAFVDFVAQVDKSKLTVQQGLDKLELLKKALMQKYFG